MKRSNMIWVALILGAGSAFAQVSRPNALWFNKVITPQRSRQLYVALNANMWLFYDLPQGVLYQAWNGGTTGGSLQNANATVSPGYWFAGGPHFPHIYVTSGTNYFKDSVGEYFASYTKPADITTYYTRWPRQPLNYKAWTVRDGSGADVGATIRYRGYTVPGNVFTLKFSLILPASAGEIIVTESPEYSNLPSGNHIVRTLNFSGIPTGYSVRLEHLGGTNASAWSVTSGSAAVAGSVMNQTANGQTVLNGSF